MLTIQTETQTIKVPTRLGVFLSYKSDSININNADTVYLKMKNEDLSKLEALAPLIEAERLEFVDLSSEYTILANEDVMDHYATVFKVRFEQNTFFILGEFIVARLDEEGNPMPLNEKDVKVLYDKLKVRASL